MAGTYLKIEDNAESTLNGAITAASTTITVTSASSYPSAFPYILTIWDEDTYANPGDDPSLEQVLVTGASTNDLTVTRGYGDSTGATHTSGEKIALLVTSAILNDATYGIETVIDTHLDNSAIHLGVDTVKDTHIDWGTGASQVSAGDIPIADAGSKITATEVEAALQENRTAIDLNTAKVTNATHTGDVTGTTSLAIDKTAITGKVAVTAVGTDYVLISDDSDTGNLKKALVSDLTGAGSSASDVAYDATTWDANTDAATKNVIRDKIETMDTAIGLNTAKVTNVSTALSVGTIGATTVAITSDGGADDVTLPAATTTAAGLLTASLFNEIGANTAKVTNVSTNLAEGTATETTVLVTSSDGTDATLVAASTTRAGLLVKAKFDEIVANTAKTGVTTQISNVVEDTTPQLGGDLDTNGKNINTIKQTNVIENTSKLLQTEDIFSDFVVTGLLPATSANLISDISLGHAYVTGVRVNTAATSKTYTASKDTYVDVNSVGTYTFVEVALDAAEPAVTADSIRLAKVVTDADNITSVTDMRLLVPATVHSSVDVVTHNAIAATASVAGHATATQITKLDGIEALADVTDAINIASSIVGVVDKATPVDADSIGLIDSAATNVLKELTWANVKATLKTYFDTLYNKYVHPNHTGAVTSVADGATTITDKAVTLTKMDDMATASLLGRNTAAIGVPEVLSKTTALALLNVADGANNYTHPTGDGNLHVIATGTINDGKVLTAGATAGALSWTAPTVGTVTAVSGTAPVVSSGGATPAISIPAATASVAGHATAAQITKLDGIAASANNYTHPNHSGDVTSVADGAQTIAANAVTNAKAAQIATATIKGRVTAATGNVEDLTAANVRTIINVADGANAYVHPNHSGDVTSTADGATVIAAKAVDVAMLADGTDGELITWSAAGVAETVAVGTATHVLTSNGVGVAPTFQASVGGSSLANIFLPAEAAYLPVTNPAGLVEELGATVYAGHSHLTFDDTTSEHAVWRVPMPDYDGGNIVVTAYSKVGATPAGAVTLQYNILTIGLANSEAFDAAVTVDTAVNISHSLNTTELLTDIMVASATIDPANVAADDLLVIELSRDVATDDLVGDGELVGIMLEYTKV